jgi:Domain of unknown function (DUF1707)
MTGPGDETAAAAAGRGHLRASRADREQAIDVLKAAFVEERLTKDEFDLRVGQAFSSRTHAELAAVTADLPAGPATTTPARKPPRPPMSNAAKAGICAVVVIITMAAAVVSGFAWALFLFVFYFAASLVAGAQLIASRHEKRSRGQRPPRPAPSTRSSQRAASAGTEQPPQVNPAQRHTAEAARARPRLSAHPA